MKKRSLFATIRPDGILRWSTACVLFGGAAGLTSCEKDYVATAEDEKIAKIQSTIDDLDAGAEKLKSGEVANNFHIAGVGYYHANKNDFFDYPYNFERDGRWFIDGVWDNFPSYAEVPASRPSKEALKKVDDALTLAQQKEHPATSSGSTTVYNNYDSGGGIGAGNMLMMYWLLSGNRGFFSPGPGFQQAGNNMDGLRRRVDQERETVRSHASSSSGYRSAYQQSRSSGSSVRSGQSVRGGFGSSSSSHSFGS